jgi:hypothetical protein
MPVVDSPGRSPLGRFGLRRIPALERLRQPRTVDAPRPVSAEPVSDAFEPQARTSSEDARRRNTAPAALGARPHVVRAAQVDAPAQAEKLQKRQQLERLESAANKKRALAGRLAVMPSGRVVRGEELGARTEALVLHESTTLVVGDDGEVEGIECSLGSGTFMEGLVVGNDRYVYHEDFFARLFKDKKVDDVVSPFTREKLAPKAQRLLLGGMVTDADEDAGTAELYEAKHHLTDPSRDRRRRERMQRDGELARELDRALNPLTLAGVSIELDDRALMEHLTSVVLAHLRLDDEDSDSSIDDDRSGITSDVEPNAESGAVTDEDSDAELDAERALPSLREPPAARLRMPRVRAFASTDSSDDESSDTDRDRPPSRHALVNQGSRDLTTSPLQVSHRRSRELDRNGRRIERRGTRDAPPADPQFIARLEEALGPLRQRR